MSRSSRTRRQFALGVSATALLSGLLPVTSAAAHPSSGDERGRGSGPEVHLTSAVPGDTLAPGLARPGLAGEGSGFALNVEAQTHGGTGIAVNEGLNIRNTNLLGAANPNFPGLTVTVDSALTTPTGGTIAAGTNLASLFNIAGTDDSPGRGVTAWAGWHVLESLAPGVRSLTVTASVTDTAGRTGTDVQTYRVSRSATTGQALTPAPGSPTATAVADRERDGRDGKDEQGPALSFAAPERPSSVATGIVGAGATPAERAAASLHDGSLFFIQLDALDVAHHGIAVNEDASGKGPIATPGLVPLGTGMGAANPNVPGLDFRFDVALRQPNGNIINAGQNLAALFNVAGSTIGRHGAVRTTLDWVVGGQLVLPAGQDSVLMTARITDTTGHSTTTTRRVGISQIPSGQALTPQP